MIDFKMTKEGLILLIKDYQNLEELLNEISARVTQMGNFFAKGDRISLMIENHAKHSQDIPRIVSHLRRLGLEVSQILIGTALGGKEEKLKVESKTTVESAGKVIKKNIRSGQTVVHSGDVIVFGNVNKGAEILAGGSVVVFGKAQGTIRAGLNEGEQAVVAALDLQPSLIQIAGFITHSKGEENIPSVAHVKGNRIVIEPFDKVNFERGE
ncbi:septum site-determining protein MinC [Thermotoga sp. KOL6]|uniref:septum site-determining protein MinC n=1 Tax=Thermotoga sp. KOL6 TaxID=126741 RepID=UPI000C75EAD5|nr:septum site-determining protein MinC [Thermotoga sp. KOL6]PLV59798.1 septum formation inhibitor [Thermotoga sp. KOL6]